MNWLEQMNVALIRAWMPVIEAMGQHRTWSDDWYYWAKETGIGTINGMPAFGGW